MKTLYEKGDARVSQIDDAHYNVSWYALNVSALNEGGIVTQDEIKGRDYVLANIPGISTGNIDMRAIADYSPNSDLVERVITGKNLFEILEQDTMTHEGIDLRLVRDKSIAKRVINRNYKAIQETEDLGLMD